MYAHNRDLDIVLDRYFCCSAPLQYLYRWCSTISRAHHFRHVLVKSIGRYGPRKPINCRLYKYVSAARLLCFTMSPKNGTYVDVSRKLIFRIRQRGSRAWMAVTVYWQIIVDGVVLRRRTPDDYYSWIFIKMSMLADEHFNYLPTAQTVYAHNHTTSEFVIFLSSRGAKIRRGPPERSNFRITVSRNNSFRLPDAHYNMIVRI